MSWSTTVAASILAVGLGSAAGAATTITFTEAEFPGNVTDAGAEYAAYGVTFDNAYYYIDSRDPFDQQGISVGFLANTSTPQTATLTFSGVTSFFTFDWWTITDDIDVYAYDAGGNLLGSFLDGVGSGSNTITANGIASVTFSGTGGFAQLSTISYDLAAIPLPGSAALLLGALGAVVLVRRRRPA